jgi:drug/metabolite transporter (DMT)-like permease
MANHRLSGRCRIAKPRKFLPQHCAVLPCFAQALCDHAWSPVERMRSTQGRGSVGRRIYYCRTMLRSLAPVLFVLVWSTGFIVARAVTSHADVQLFLLVRFAAVALVLGIAAIAGKASWVPPKRALKHLAVGAITLGLYLSVSFWAIAQGLPAGIMALMGALQPLLTAAFMLARGRGPSSAALWLGLFVGFLGVVLVLLPRLESSRFAVGNLANLGGVLAIVALTFGTLGQKHLSSDDLRVAGCLQNLGAGLVALLAVTTIGSMQWDGSAVLWALLAWSALITSVLAQSLLIWMMRHGAATHVTALMLLVPPVAALLAYALFHETLSLLQMTGFALALGGVVLARRANPVAA